jgi:hypothetical protein
MQRVTFLEVRVVQKDGQHMWHARVPHTIELRSRMLTANKQQDMVLCCWIWARVHSLFCSCIINPVLWYCMLYKGSCEAQIWPYIYIYICCLVFRTESLQLLATQIASLKMRELQQQLDLTFLAHHQIWICELTFNLHNTRDNFYHNPGWS